MTPEIITVAGVAAGYGVGLIAEHRAVSHAAETQVRLLEAAGPALREEALPAPFSRRERLTRWASRNLLAPLVLSAAVAGGLEAAGWVSNSVHSNTPPALEVVVDRSGATKLPLDGKPAIGEIDSIVSQLQGIKRVTAQAEVASFGGVVGEKLSDVRTTKAIGDAPLEQATKSALDNANLIASKTSGNAKHQAAIVVLTNGNSIGSSSDIVSRAKAEGDVPAFIINVEGAGSPATADLRTIARNTGGKYWDARQGNVKTVAQDVQSAIADGHQEKPAEKPADWTDRIFGGIALVAAIGYFRRRRSYTLGKGPKGE